jgi:hypothetical protein
VFGDVMTLVKAARSSFTAMYDAVTFTATQEWDELQKDKGADSGLRRDVVSWNDASTWPGTRNQTSPKLEAKKKVTTARGTGTTAPGRSPRGRRCGGAPCPAR